MSSLGDRIQGGVTSNASKDEDSIHTKKIIKNREFNDFKNMTKKQKIFSDIEPNNIYLTCCINANMPILTQHFMKYYKNIGIENFLIIVNSLTDNNKELNDTLDILSKYNIYPEIWIGIYDVHTYREKRLALQYTHCSKNDWVVGVDLDEFVGFPNEYKSFPELLNYCDNNKINCVRGIFVDRISDTGELKKIESYPDISIQFPIKCEITKLINKAWVSKIIAFKGDMETITGHHYLSYEYEKNAVYYPEILDVNHYKWDITIIDRIKKLISIPNYNNIDIGWYEEGNRFLKYINKNGKIDINNINL